MSVLPCATNQNLTEAYFLLARASTLNVGFISAGTITAGQGLFSTISTNILKANDGTISSISTTSITLDGNTLDTGGTGFGSVLLLNGVPIATLCNISSLADWAYYPAVSTIDANTNNIVNAKNIFGNNVTLTNNATATTANLKIITSSNIVNSNDIMTVTLEATGLVQAGSISTSGLLQAGSLSTNTLNAGTITGLVGNFSTLAGTVIFPSTVSGLSTLVVSTLSSINTTSVTGTFTNISSQNVYIASGLTVDATPTFNSGGNFNGARPNFNTGFVTSSANNFNNTNLDNVGRITGNTVFIGSPNYVTVNTSTNTTVVNDRGADVGGSSVISLTSKFGQSTRVNITADTSSAYSPTPTQIITLTANGATSLTQNAVGGRVSIVANAGSGTGCNILGFGQIDMTAYSSLPFAGVIKESAGSILAYSGAGSPLVGVYGYSFYSALNCLSLTAGSTPPSGSYPGVVYLRGDNGTKVVNGFYADNATISGTTDTSNVITNSITAPGTSSITIQAATNNISFVASTATFLCGIAGDLSVKSLVNLSSINGAPYSPGGGSTVSTFTSLFTSSFTVSSINGAAYNPGGSSWVSTATTQLNMNGNQITDLTGTLLLNVSSPTQYTSYAQTSTSIDMLQAGGSGYIRRNVAGNILDTAVGNIQTQATSTINTVPATYFSGDVKVTTSLTRRLISADVAQPVVQYGYVSTIGISSTINVTIPNRYTSATSYIPFGNVVNDTSATFYVSSLTRGTFAITYVNSLAATTIFAWNTLGT